ncbi:MAG: hypothetical protein LBT56_08415, partial [Prevotellaceae bacterium]|nr:hypothetical protein [Prevotellaceae bacterium]
MNNIKIKNMIKKYIFLALLFNTFVTFAQQKTKKEYEIILKKVSKNFEKNYNISQSAGAKYYEFSDVKYYEYAFRGDNFDMYYCIEAEGTTHKIYIPEFNNQRPGEFYYKKANLLNIKKTDTEMSPLEDTDRLIREAKL